MNEKDLRKQMTIVIYSLIFKRILPTMDGSYKIGNLEYATKINQLMKHRTLATYEGTVFETLNLIITDNSAIDVKDSNFNNWVNGTSNPKSYGIINALLEYVYETCQAEDRLMQLKLDLLGIISQEDFSSYTNHLIDPILSHWVSQLKNDATLQEVITILKEILYLLKDKSRHSSYLLHNQSISSVEPTQKPAFYLSQKLRKILGFSLLGASCLVIAVLVITSLFDPSRLKNAKEQADISDDLSVFAAPSPTEVTENVVVDMNAITAIPTDKELATPELLSPSQNSILPYAPLTIRWLSVDAASYYMVAIKNRRTDAIVFEANNVTDTTLDIDAKYFLHGEQYLLYVIARKDHSSSEAAVFSFNIEMLPAPKIITTPDKSPIPLAPVTVEWLPVDGADTYQVVVTDMERWVKVFEKNYMEQTRITLDRSLFFPGIEYRIYIASQNSSALSQPHYVDIKIAPLETPTILFPLNNAMIDNETLQLKWEPVQFATSYNIDIVETNLWETVFSYEGQTDTTMDIDPTLFQVGGKYRIYLFAMFGKSSSQPAYLDLKATDLLPPQITAPLNNAILPRNDITLTWDNNPIADYYKVVVTDTITWESVTTYERIIGNSLTLDKRYLNLDNPYRIYVSSFSKAIESAPNYIDIRIEGLPIPKILSPLHQTQYEDQAIKIEWAPTPYISTYKVSITDLSTWTTIFINTAVLGESIILDRTLLTPGSSYRVYVQSIMGPMESEPAYVDFKIN